MKPDQAISEILNHVVRRDFITKVLSLVIPISGLIVTTGLLTNLLGEFHLQRFILNSIMLLILVFAFILIRKGKIFYSIQYMLVSIAIMCTVSTFVNGGVKVPNYMGFFVLLVIANTFSSKRTVLQIYGVFVIIGGISTLLPLNPLHQNTFPTPFRYWTIYSLFGLIITGVLIVTRQAFSEAIIKVANREALLSSIFVSISDPLIVFDEHKNVTQMNPSAAQLSQVLYKHNQVQLHEATVLNLHTNQYASLIHHIDFNVRQVQALTVNITINNRQIWYAITASPQLLDKQFVGMVVSIQDITHQHHLIQYQKLNAVGILANGIAHDFNNMLGAIKNSSEIMKPYLNDDLSEHLTIIEEATHRSTELTKQLMSFSRKGSTQFHDINLHELLNKVVTLLRRISHSNKIIELDLMEGPSFIYGDEGQVHSALMNLGINAIQSMSSKTKGTLTFQTSLQTLSDDDCRSYPFDLQAGDFVCVKVKDEGEGIPPAILARIFEPFFTTKTLGEGTGLGLSVVHRMIDRHGGAINIQSQVGLGSCFTLLFPVKLVVSTQESCEALISTDPMQTQLPKPTQFKKVNPQDPIHILIIDDEKLIRKTLSKILKTMGFQSKSAESGDEGLQILRDDAALEIHYDLIILDMLMPQRTGREVFYDLKVEFPSIPVILSSGFTPEEILNELTEQGLAGVLQKPYLPNDLRTTIEQTLTLRMDSHA